MEQKSLAIIILYTIPMWVLAWTTGVLYIADLASVLGTAIVLQRVVKLLSNPKEMTKFLQLGALFLVLIQNLSWLLSTAIHYLNFKFTLDTSLYNELKLNVEDYSLAIIYTSIFALFLSVFSKSNSIRKLENKVSHKLFLFRNFAPNKLKLTLVIILVINIALVFLGIIGQRSLNIDGIDNGKNPFWMPLYEMLLPFAALLNAVFYLKITERKNYKYINWIILIASFLVLLFINFTKGRTPFIFIILSHFYWYYFFSNSKPNFKKLIPLGIICYPIISFLVLFNNYTRNTISRDLHLSALESLPIAFNKFINSVGEEKEERRSTTVNLSTRSLVAHPLALCIKLPEEKKTYILGENIINSMVWAIPGNLIANKKQYPVQEELLYKNFPIGLLDTADSLYLFSYVDFGWFGIIIYPLLIILFWIFVLSTIDYVKLSSFFIAITYTSFFNLYTIGMGENALVTWFVILRTFIFISFISYIFRLFTNKDNMGIHQNENIIHRRLEY